MDLDGYVWGVKWQLLYPGAGVVEDSPRALQWSEALGIEFHEVCIETNTHRITLIIHELAVDKVSAGYHTFTAGDEERPDAHPSPPRAGDEPDG